MTFYFIVMTFPNHNYEIFNTKKHIKTWIKIYRPEMPQLRISHFRQDRNFKLKVKAQIVEKIKILKYERFQTF